MSEDDEVIYETQPMKRTATGATLMHRLNPRQAPQPVAPATMGHFGYMALEISLLQSQFWDTECEWFEGNSGRIRSVARVHSEVTRAIYDLALIDEHQLAMVEAITQLIERGVYENTAARVFGMNAREHKKLRAKSPYYDLAVRTAAAIAESGLVEIVRASAGSGEWKAATWLLERRFPERYGKKESKEINKKVDVNHTHSYIQKTPKAELYRAAKDILDAEIVEDDKPALPPGTSTDGDG